MPLMHEGCSSAFRNRCVFSVFLKLSALSDRSRRSSGSAFQAIGPVTENSAATMSWYDKMVVAGRSKSLTTGNIRCGVAAVHAMKLCQTQQSFCHRPVLSLYSFD